MSWDAKSVLGILIFQKSERNAAYYEFIDTLKTHSRILRRFRSELLSGDRSIDELRRIYETYAKILTLEVNHNFEILYGVKAEVTWQDPVNLRVISEGR